MRKTNLTGSDVAFGILAGLAIVGTAYVEATRPVSDLELEIRRAKNRYSMNLQFSGGIDTYYVRRFLSNNNLHTVYDLYESIRTDKIINQIKDFDSKNYYYRIDRYGFYESLVNAFTNDYPEMYQVLKGDRIRRALG